MAELSRLQGYTTAAASGHANSDKACVIYCQSIVWRAVHQLYLQHSAATHVCTCIRCHGNSDDGAV